MCELQSLFQNMNTFSQSDFVLPHMENVTIPFIGGKSKFGSIRGGVCRNGFSKTNSESVTRNKHSEEVEFERRSSQCHIQKQESDKYKIMNLLHQVNASKKTVDSNDVVRVCEETIETKIIIMEKRYGTVPGKMVHMVWNRLKKLMPVGSKDEVKTKGVIVESQKNPIAAESLVEGKPLEEIELKTNEDDDDNTNMSPDAAVIVKKKKNFLQKLALKGKRHEAAVRNSENIFQPLQSVSDIVNDVQSKNRLLELIDPNKSEIYRLPLVQCAISDQSTSGPQPDHDTVQKFFTMKFILARKKPSLPP